MFTERILFDTFRTSHDITLFQYTFPYYILAVVDRLVRLLPMAKHNYVIIHIHQG